MAENTLALLRYLTAPESPLPTLKAGHNKPSTVYFYAFNHFFVYSFATAEVLYTLLLTASLVLVKVTFVDPSPAMRRAESIGWQQTKGVIAHSLALVGAVAGANAVAFIMAEVLNKKMTWFSVELSCLVLYGPPALIGAFFS